MVKKRTALLLLCVILLASCGTQPRILTELTPGEHVPYVELSDGYLYFIESPAENPYQGFSSPTVAQSTPQAVLISFRGYSDPITYDEAVAEMGFNPAEATAHLPEHLQIGEAIFHEDTGRFNDGATDIPTDDLIGGFLFYQEHCGFWDAYPAPHVTFSLRIQQAGGHLEGYGTGGGTFANFRVFPWVRTRPDFDRYYPDDYFAHYRPSQVGDITVGAMHVYHHITNDIFVGYWEMYYAGWYVNDVAFVLECTNGYCTQEEFIQLLLALIDGAIAQDTHWQGRQAALEGA